MNRILRGAKFGFTGFIVGYILALVLGQWIWLDMRVNIALIVPVCILAGIGLALWNQCLNSKFWLWIPEAIVCLILLVLYWGRLDAITVIPGIIFKEALYLGFINLDMANILLVLVLILGNALWFINTACELQEK
ncbi:MAG: hypothetical protein M0Z31_14810 [Clostridia bacterium]|nr:hypothetical protein [Clostridia bacterium]